MAHIPVLTKEVIEILNPKPNENFIDATIGGGGHAVEIFQRILPNGRLLGTDLDKNSLEIARIKISTEIKNQKSPKGSLRLPTPVVEQSSLRGTAGQAKIKNNLILVQDNFANLEKIIKEYNFAPTSGILFDLGMSSEEIETSGRGFSFLRNEPLDMRFNAEIQNSKLKNNNLTAGDIVNNFNEKELSDIFWKYGEEKFGRRIAREIIKERKRKPIETTFGLVAVIKKAAPKNYERGRIHPATRIFQALRICVNDELNNLRNGLAAAVNILSPGGRLAAISFHSLEDRIVKNYFREMEKAGKIKILTAKPITPSREEINNNKKARSAKLRAAEII